MTTDQLSALKSRLELAVNETTGEFCEDLRSAVRVVAAMEKLERMGSAYIDRGAIKTGNQGWITSKTLIQAIEAAKESQ